jgi:hypothetical protein
VRSDLAGQRLRLGEAPVPIASAVDVTVGGGETRIDFDVRLRAVPETVLGLDPNRMPVLWEGLGAGGAPVLVVGGTVDLGDPGETELPLAGLYRAYARLSDLKLTPSLGAVSVHALLSLYNPFGFDVVATSFEFRLTVGSQTMLSGKRPGFRLRAGRRSDVLIEQDVPLGDVAEGAAAFLRGEAAQLDGVIPVAIDVDIAARCGYVVRRDPIPIRPHGRPVAGTPGVAAFMPHPRPGYPAFVRRGRGNVGADFDGIRRFGQIFNLVRLGIGPVPGRPLKTLCGFAPIPGHPFATRRQ